MTNERDEAGDRIRLLPTVVVGTVVVVAAVIAGVALAQSDNTPAGETLLENANEQYRTAESLTGSAEVTVSNATANQSTTVEYAAADADGVRLTVSHDGVTATFGINGTVAWASAPALGLERTWTTDSESADGTHTCKAAKNRLAALATNHTGPMAASKLSGRSGATDSDATSPTVAGPVGALATNPEAIDCEAMATQWTNEKRTLPANLSAANLTATTTGSTTVDGIEAYTVAIEPENASSDTNATVTIAKNDSRVLESRVSDGENTTHVRYHDQGFNVSMAESTFAPPDTRAASGTYDEFGALNDATKRDLPQLDAEGFAFETAAVTHTGGGTTVAQRYANVTMNATLVSTNSASIPFDASNGTHIDLGGYDATATTMRGRTVIAWTNGGTTYAVVTDESTDEAVTLARTVSVPS